MVKFWNYIPLIKNLKDIINFKLNSKVSRKYDTIVIVIEK